MKKDNITRREIYKNIIQLIIHSENLSWNRFYIFLVFNTIIIVSWSTLYVKEINQEIIFYLIIICILGFISGIFWCFLGIRGRKYLKEFKSEAIKLEDDSKLWPNKLINYKIFTKDKVKHNWAGSYYILTIGSLLFTVLYVVLFFVSIKHQS